MQCWDITLEAVSFRNNAASRRVKEHDTSCCLRAGTLSQPAHFWFLFHSLCIAFVNISKFKTQDFLFLNCKLLLLEICEMLLCVHNYIWQPCTTEKMKWHVHCETPKEYCSKFSRATGTFPRLIWLLSPVEGELELFWIILCQISRLTKWIWLTYENWINPCFIPNGSLSPEMIVNSTYFGFRTLAT